VLSVCQIDENRLREEGHIAHETAVCRNPPIPSFAGDEGGNLTIHNRPIRVHVAF
jgi:hypothetical protein